MTFLDFKTLVSQRHPDDRYAAALWTVMDDAKVTALNRPLEPSDIPCIAWCILTFDLPIALAKACETREAMSREW